MAITKGACVYTCIYYIYSTARSGGKQGVGIFSLRPIDPLGFQEQILAGFYVVGCAERRDAIGGMKRDTAEDLALLC